MKKSLILFIIFSFLFFGRFILAEDISSNIFSDYEILCPNLFLNNDNLSDDEIVKKIDEAICFYKKGYFGNLKYYSSSIEYKNKTSYLFSYKLEKEYSKNKILESVKVIIDKKEVKNIPIIKNKDLKKEIIGPDTYIIKKGYENTIYPFLESFKINSYENKYEPFKLFVYLKKLNEEEKINTFDNLSSGKYNLVVKGKTILGKELVKNVYLYVRDENLKIHSAQNDVRINLEKRRPHEDIILNIYKDILKSRKIYVKEIYLEKTNYKDFDKSGNSNYMNVIYKDDKNILYKDSIEITKTSLKKEKDKNLSALYLTIFLAGFILIGIGYTYTLKFIRNKIATRKIKNK